MRQVVHLDGLLLGPTNSELRITISYVFLKAIVNSLKIFDISLPRIMGFEVLLQCFCSTVPSTMRSSLLDDIVRDWENIQSPLVDTSAEFFLSRDAHKCTEREGILTIALYLGIVSHNSNRSTLPMSRIIFFDFSLNGL